MAAATLDVHFYELTDETVWGATARILTGLPRAPRRPARLSAGARDHRVPHTGRRAILVTSDCAERRSVGGSRDRDRQDRPAGLRVRRHRDRAQPAHARPRRRRHHLGGRRVQVRAADDGGRDGRRRVARDRDRDRSPRRPRRASTSKGSWTRYEDPEPVFEEIASLPAEKATRRMQELYDEPIKPELIPAAHPRDQGRRRHCVRVAHAAARRAVREARARRRARHPRRAGHGGVGRARVEGSRSASRST